MTRGWLRGFLYGSTALCALAATPAYANPQNGVVAAGSATIQQSGNVLDITETSSRAVIDWGSFNIGRSETTQFNQPSSSAIILNRVNASTPSWIDGQLLANGNVVIVNPNGVVFGKSATVDVGGLTVSTSNTSNDQFMNAATPAFNQPGNPNARIINRGTITAAEAGLVGLVAPQVINSGTITAKLGKVTLASGDTFTLDMAGDGLTQIAMSADTAQQLVKNSGTISADGGTITMTAAAARETINSLVENSGTLRAESVGEQDGVITLYAEGSNAVQGNVAANKGQTPGSSAVQVSGTIDASGQNQGETGGTVQVLADNVTILSGATINASGQAGGGTIQIGGDFHGQGTTPTALTTTVDNGANIYADALASGNGGNVTVWADGYTMFAGMISAMGGPQGGNGGYVETSGHDLLSLQDANGNNGMVLASAPNGQAGTWLLDPADLVITSSTSNITTENNTPAAGDTTYIPNGTATTSDILNTTIQTALNAGTNVFLTTGGDSEAGPNGGSITVSAAISATGAGTALTQTGSLTLSSYRNIVIQSGDSITLGGGTNTSSQTVTGGNLTLQADNHSNGAGAIQVLAAIATNGGNITMGGGSGTITAGSLNADGSLNTAASGFATGISANVANEFPHAGIYIKNVSVNAGGANGGGNIIMNGNGYAAIGSAIGVYINGSSASVTTTGNGTISISGNGGGSIGNATDGGYGIELYEATISAVDGNSSTYNAITLIGQGGGNPNAATSSRFNYGVGVEDGTSIKTTGKGNILINGTGGTGTGLDEGIDVGNNSSSIEATGSGNLVLITPARKMLNSP